ncbi:Gfo/Idh/MocA family protein [Pseudonocardia nematodicida]|uniref:Gfo/Idh/MocA family protein n=1 Tax=Pseudonocardia nematodicida TaxID=1206997 RepID=UPI003613F892
MIGTGAIAATHAAAISETKDVDLVAVGSRTPSRARAFIEHHQQGWRTEGRVAAATVEEILDDPRVELVSVVTPTGTHVGIGTRVLEARRHLVLEKPVDVDLRRALAFADVAAEAEASGLVAAVVSQQRFGPAATRVREAIDAGRMGTLTSGVVSVGWWRSQAYYDRDDWRGTWAHDGGALMNQGVHTLDLLVWYFGEPVRVSAGSRLLAHRRIEVEDTVAAVVEFESGAIATVHATTAAFPGLAARLQVMGTRGSAVIEHEGLSYLHLAGPTDVGDMGLHGAGNQVVAPDPVDNRDATTTAAGHARQFADVSRAILDGRRTLVTVEDAVRTLRTVHAIYRSATEGRPVDLAELGQDPSPDAYRVGTVPPPAVP